MKTGNDQKWETNTPTVKTRQEFEVVKLKPEAPQEYKLDGGKTFRLGDKTDAMLIRSDPGLARELDARYGDRTGTGELLTIPVERPIDPIHKRTFLVRLPKNYRREACESK